QMRFITCEHQTKRKLEEPLKRDSVILNSKFPPYSTLSVLTQPHRMKATLLTNHLENFFHRRSLALLRVKARFDQCASGLIQRTRTGPNSQCRIELVRHHALAFA